MCKQLHIVLRRAVNCVNLLLWLLGVNTTAMCWMERCLIFHWNTLTLRSLSVQYIQYLLILFVRLLLISPPHHCKGKELIKNRNVEMA